MSHIVTIAGSPSANAKSSALLAHAHHQLRKRCVSVKAISVRDLPAEDLLHGRFDSPAIQEANTLLARAEGVIVATPVYKASYSGILKAYFDLLPQDALAGKVVLPIATGGSPAHLLALDFALKPLISALGATQILRGVYVTDAQVQFEHGGVLSLDETIEARLDTSLCELVASVRADIGIADLVWDGFQI